MTTTSRVPGHRQPPETRAGRRSIAPGSPQYGAGRASTEPAGSSEETCPRKTNPLSLLGRDCRCGCRDRTRPSIRQLTCDDFDFAAQRPPPETCHHKRDRSPRRNQYPEGLLGPLVQTTRRQQAQRRNNTGGGPRRHTRSHRQVGAIWYAAPSALPHVYCVY